MRQFAFSALSARLSIVRIIKKKQKQKHEATRVRVRMSLHEVQPNLELERNSYHTLSRQALAQRVAAQEPEALYVYGTRLRLGINAEKNEEAGWAYTVAAAQLGHPVALGKVCETGQGTEPDHERAVQLYHLSAERGHPIGMRGTLSRFVISN
jgi:TPR repeat protein